MAPHSKELSEDLRIRIAARYKKIWVTAWNCVTVQGPGSYRGFPRRVSLRTGLTKGLIKEVESLCCASGAEAGLQKTDA